MARYALIGNEVVENVVLLEEEHLAPVLWPDKLAVNIEGMVPLPWIGWGYDYETGEFAPPPPPPAEPEPTPE
jgi:hypothetical protein